MMLYLLTTVVYILLHNDSDSLKFEKLPYMRVTPPFWYAVFRGGGLDGTQYAKGWYAVRRNSVISYADIIFYF